MPATGWHAKQRESAIALDAAAAHRRIVGKVAEKIRQVFSNAHKEIRGRGRRHFSRQLSGVPHQGKIVGTFNIIGWL